MTAIGIIGTGNVGLHLVKEFSSNGHFTLEVWSRNPIKTATISKEYSVKQVKDKSSFSSDIIFVCVPEHALQEVIHEIPEAKKVIFTGGSVDLDAFNRTNKGIFYPMQTFSSNKELTVRDYPVFIEGSTNEILQDLESICSLLGKKCFNSTYSERISYHLTAVWVNNFTNHVLFQAKELADSNQLNWELFFPLIEETIAKMKILGPEAAQTGPARRKDLTTIQQHLDLLNSHQRAIYELMTQSILKTYNPAENGEL